MKRKSTPSSDGRKSRWHTRALNTNDVHTRRRPRTNWRPDGRADTVCVAFFCVRLRGTAGGGRPPVWCGRRVRAPFGADGTPTDSGWIRKLRKREHATPPSTATRNRPRRRLEQGQGQGQTAAAGTCLRFAARDVLGWAFATHRERSVSAYGNNDDGVDEGRRGRRAVYYFYTPRRKRRHRWWRRRRRVLLIICFSRFFYGSKRAMIRILIFLNSKPIDLVK